MLEKSKENLKTYGWLFVFLGIWDIIWPFISYFLSNKVDLNDLANQYNVGVNYLYIALTIIAILIIFFAVIKIVVGKSAMDKANNKPNAKLHTGWAKFLLVMEIIALILGFFPSNGQLNYYSLATSFANIWIIFDMLKYNKELSK